MEDLRAKAFAFVDPKSTAGYPAVQGVLQDKGIAVAEHFGGTERMGDPRTSWS